MLEIKAIQDKHLQEQICIELGEVFDADTLAYSIYDSDILIGIVQFAIKGNCGIIYTISKSDDMEALITAIRAVFNFIEICGIKDVYFKDDRHDDEMIKKLFFNKKDGTWHINLEGFFDTPCHP
jgi:hypothetical protein